VPPFDVQFDLLVIGGGTANKVAAHAADHGMDTALVEPGPLGGTCLNRGCNPTKMLIQYAEAADAVRAAGEFGVDATLDGIDYAGAVESVNEELGAIAAGMKETRSSNPNLTIVEEYVEFVDDRTVVDDGGTEYSGEKVVVAAGSRPVVPPVDSLEDVDYVTSDEAIRLPQLPDELVVLGGGYVAVELGYFFEAMGSSVTIVEMMDTLVPNEDDAVGEVMTDVAADRHDVHTGYRATSVEGGDGRISVTAEAKDGAEVVVEGDELLVAAGRRPNTDTLAVEAGGIDVDDRGFVVTDDRLRTAADGVWAMGDVADNSMFKHTADYEAEIAKANVVHGEERSTDFTAVPHAIFTEPQVAAVGATEGELQEAGRAYAVGRVEFGDTAIGRSQAVEDGFVKVLADPDSREVLGCHVVCEEAATMIHEASTAMRAGLTVDDVADAIHAHPSLPRVLESAFGEIPSP
jgi:mycothione reductase